MAPTLTRQLVRVAVDQERSEASCLVFADDVLVAIISKLEQTVDGELKDQWYLEAGFGRCDGVIPHPLFKSKEEAWTWVASRMSGG